MRKFPVTGMTGRIQNILRSRREHFRNLVRSKKKSRKLMLLRREVRKRRVRRRELPRERTWIWMMLVP